MSTPFDAYLTKIAAGPQGGQATELTYRSALETLKAPALDAPITTYPIAGSNQVDKVRYEKKRVWINAEQYFGGSQVCSKWLKDRKGRQLSGDDIAHYQRIVVALKETLRLMAEIDKTIPRWPIE